MSITEPKSGTVTIDGYHGHVYYAPETRTLAEQVRETLAATFGVEARQLSDAPIGPHLVPQFRFTFTTAQFDTIVPWLMLNRQGLDVLVHPLTDRLLRRPQSLCDLAWFASRADARHPAARLSRGAVSNALTNERRAPPPALPGRAA
jgi:DOPA 4,5-dioxygenase